MAALIEISDEMREEYRQWCASRPEHVRVVCERLPPWELYRMKSTGNRCTILSFGEEMDGVSVSLTVQITGEFNLTLFDRQVFGVNPDDLEPCEIPAEDEPVGTMMTPAEVDDNIDTLREMVLGSRDRQKH